MTPEARLAWLRERQTCIGASDAPDLIGVGFNDEHRVYRSKTEPIDPDAPVPALLRLGLDLEPLVASRFFERTGLVVETCGHVRHPARTWQAASPDRLAFEPAHRMRRVVELKTVARFGDEWGPDGSECVPAGYRAQVWQQVGVGSFAAPLEVLEDFAYLAALCRSTGEFRVYTVPFDVEGFCLLTQVEERAWKDHIEPRVPFTHEWAEKYGGAVRARAVVKGAIAELPPEAAEMVRRRQELKGLKEEADAEIDRLSAAIDDLMGTHEKAKVPGFTVQRIHNPGGPVPASFRRPYTYLTVRPDRRKKEEL